VKTFTFVVPDPPPLRGHPGRSARRDDPYAGPLARAGEALVAAHPDALPFVFGGIVVRYGRTVWNVDPLGYQPDHPIFEVLGDVGAMWDPEAWWNQESQDPDADFYVVTFTSDVDGSGPGPSQPISVWTDVPAEFHYHGRRR
jgi:hypothetical protein